MASVSALAGPVSRTYVVTHNARTHAVQLYHNTVTGERSLNLDAAEVLGTAGRTTVFSSPATLVFTIGSANGIVTITPAGTAVHYACTFDGAPVAEENTLHVAEAGADTVNRLKVTVASADLGVDSAGKPLVLFLVHTVRELDLRETTVHRRFSDFFAVNEALRAAYQGSHLLGSFPSLPPRSVKLFEDHLSKAFVEKRRWLLQDWLHKVQAVPRVRTNEVFLTFLGIIDRVRETSLLFPPGPSLGLTLRAARDGIVEVSAVKPECPVHAAATIIRPGDKVR